MYDHIVVAVDGSEPAGAAAAYAVEIARELDASLGLLSVVEASTVPVAGANVVARETPEEPGREALDERTRAAIDALEARAADAGVSTRTFVERGVPQEELAALVDRLDADLVAMGTHGRSGIDRVLLGSVAEGTLRTSEVPVLATPDVGTERLGLEDVLVPTDGSECADRGLDHAIALARPWDGTIHALAVVDVRGLAGGYAAGPTIPSVVEEIEQECQQDVGGVVERATDAGLEATSEVREGLPNCVVDEYAESVGADLVAMGTHGRSGLERHLLGSVTERTIRTTDRPVLAVPP